MPVQVGPCTWKVNTLLVGQQGIGLFEAGGQLYFQDTVVPAVALAALGGGDVVALEGPSCYYSVDCCAASAASARAMRANHSPSRSRCSTTASAA